MAVTHYGEIVCEAACENATAVSGDRATTDIRDVDCEHCLVVRERYLREALKRVEVRLSTIRNP